MALAGGLGIAGFAAPAFANNGNHGSNSNASANAGANSNAGGGSANTPANNNGYNCGANGSVSTCPAGKTPGSVGNVPENKDIPPGILGNTHAKGLCSDFATSGSDHGQGNHQGRGASQKGNPAHECTPPGTPPVVSGGCVSNCGGQTVIVSGTTQSNTPTPTPTPSVTTSSSPGTSVLGETISRPAAATSAPSSAAPVAATAVKKLPFTGPGHVGTLVGLGLSTLILGSGLLLATRREALVTVSS